MGFDVLFLPRSATKNTLTLAKADKQELWGGEGGARERQGRMADRDSEMEKLTERQR